MNTASLDDVRRALRRFVAVGTFPPWRGQNSDVNETDVRREWVDACRHRGVAGEELDEAVDAWTSKATSSSRWPAPGDVLPNHGSARVAHIGPVAGCRRCTDEGYREVAHHHEDAQGRTVVDIFCAYCDCPRGEHYRQQRALPLDSKGPARQAGARLSDVVDNLRNRPSTLAVYVDPTPGQRRTAPVVAPSSAVIAGLRAQLGDWQRNAGRYEDEQRRRKADEGRQRFGGDADDEDGARW